MGKKTSPKTSTALPLCLGGPGSGKGTQSLKIAERYGFQYVSVGELLRKKMIHNATSNRKWSLIAKIITNGELAPQVAEQPRRRGGRLFVWKEKKDESGVCPVTRRSLSQRACNRGLISSIYITRMLQRRMLICLISILLCNIMTLLGKAMDPDPLRLFALRCFKRCILW